MAIDTVDIIKIAASSSVGSAALGWFLNHIFVHKAALRRDAKYVALRTATVLEKFAVDCANGLVETDMHRQSGGSAGDELASMPAMETFPTDADWKAVSIDLTDRIMSIPAELAEARRTINFYWSAVGDDDHAREELERQTAKAGLRAWKLAVDLRRRYRIPSSRADQSWAFEPMLQEKAADKEKSYT